MKKYNSGHRRLRRRDRDGARQMLLFFSVVLFRKIGPLFKVSATFELRGLLHKKSREVAKEIRKELKVEGWMIDSLPPILYEDKVL